MTQVTGKADLHVHTAAGDGMAEVQELLDYVQESTNLDVIAVTDHDSLEGAWQARQRWARGRYRFEVIVGMEVTTLEGHILALFLEAPVPSLRPLPEFLEAVHRQGGLCIIPHPLSWLTRSVGEKAIENVLASGRDGAYFDGLETANCSLAARVGLDKARRLNRERYHLAEVGGSDAHFLKAIGSAYTEFSGATGEDLRQAVLERRTKGVSGRHPGVLEIGLGQVARQSWRGLTITPRRLGWRATAKSFMQSIFPFLR